MTDRIWDKFLTERDKAVFAAGGFGARAGFGKRPALLVIDVNWEFCGERPEPISGLDQALAHLPRGGELVRARIHQIADRGSSRQGVPGHLHHGGAAPRQLGCRQLAMEEHTRRRGERFRAR
jgi:hypothetical protein